MSKLCIELESKFATIEAKIEKKKENVNIIFNNQSKLLDDKFNIDYLTENYSKGLNIYRDALLNQISLNTKFEIDQVNEALARNDENKALTLLKKKRQFLFKHSVYKSNTICIRKLLINEFKFCKKFSIDQLKKYQHVLKINKIIGFLNKKGDDADKEIFLFATEQGILEIVEYLVENGADVNAKDKYNNPTLILA